MAGRVGHRRIFVILNLIKNGQVAGLAFAVVMENENETVYIINAGVA